jgi:hypothetical protein
MGEKCGHETEGGFARDAELREVEVKEVGKGSDSLEKEGE